MKAFRLLLQSLPSQNEWDNYCSNAERKLFLCLFEKNSFECGKIGKKWTLAWIPQKARVSSFVSSFVYKYTNIKNIVTKIDFGIVQLYFSAFKCFITPQNECHDTRNKKLRFYRIFEYLSCTVTKNGVDWQRHSMWLVIDWTKKKHTHKSYQSSQNQIKTKYL